MDKMKSSHEKEEQLLMSAWHKLVTNLNRNSTDERINSLGSSFLSQQRNLSKRQSSSTNLPNINAASPNIQNNSNKNF
jgi:hypothetical protein